MTKRPISKHKLFWLLIFGTVGATLLVYYVTAQIFKDDFPPDDSDFAVVRHEVSPDENVYVILLNGTSDLQLPDDRRGELRQLITGKKWDDKLAADLLAKNEKCSATWHLALAAPGFQVPDDYHIYTSMPYLTDWLKFADLALLRSLVAMKEGHDADAFEQCFALLAFGQRAEDCAGTIVPVIVGLSIKVNAIKAMSMLLAQTRLSSDELKPYLKRLDAFHESDPGYTNALKAEYHSMYSAIEDFQSGRLDIGEMITETPFSRGATSKSPQSKAMRMVFRPNQTKHMFYEYYHQVLSQLDLPYSLVNHDQLNGNDLRKTPAHLISANAAGKILFSVAIPTYDSILKNRCRYEASLSATQILIALHHYKEDADDLPDSLTSLVPAYLPAVPLDRFDGKPMRYSKTKRIIYSIGSDLIDSGGDLSDKGSSSSTEPTFAIPF